MLKRRPAVLRRRSFLRATAIRGGAYSEPGQAAKTPGGKENPRQEPQRDAAASPPRAA